MTRQMRVFLVNILFAIVVAAFSLLDHESPQNIYTILGVNQEFPVNKQS